MNKVRTFARNAKPKLDLDLGYLVGKPVSDYNMSLQMAKKFLHTPDTEKEFYFYLGLLATLFSKMEANLLDILGLLIMDNFVLTATLLEKNSLAQNIELLKKINQYRRYEEPRIKILAEKISHLRVSRNLFVHGVWGAPYKEENDIVIECTQARVLLEEGARGRRTWAKTTNHRFRLSYLRRLTQQLEDIIYLQEGVLTNLNGHEFE